MSSLKQSPRLAVPRYATARPEGPTMGPAICNTMRLLGMEPMPWQEWAADVIGEIDPATGLYRWPVVVITVPRQAGKTALLSAVSIHRTLTRPGSKVWYTAQTGQDASKRWTEMWDAVSRSALAPAFKVRRSNGQQRMWVPAHGGQFCPHPPGEENLHGEQSDLNVIDEAWAFDEKEGAALEQAIQPTQNSRAGAQTIYASTMGTAASTWFHSKVDRARAGDPGMAILDWGIRDGDDASDLDIVEAAHPAIGYTFDRDRLERSFVGMSSTAAFARGYGNRATGSAERLLPLDSWQAAQSDRLIPDTARISFAAAVDIDRTETAIAAAWTNPQTNIPMLEIVDVRPGVEWAIQRIKDLDANHSHGGICIDQVGPSGPLYDALTRDGIEIEKISPRELTAACGEFYDRIIQDPPKLSILPHPDLDRAADLVSRRHLGDAWAWSRRGSAGSIAALEAATLAMHQAQHQLAEPVPIEIRF